MNNPTTLDRRDVAHSNNPVGEQGYVGEFFTFSATTPAVEGADVMISRSRIQGQRPIYANNIRSAH